MMVASEGFELAAGAATGKVFDDVAHGVYAARQHSAVRLPAEAYGKLCSFLPHLLNPVENATTDTLGKHVEVLIDLAGKMLSAHRLYAQADVDSASSMRNLS